MNLLSKVGIPGIYHEKHILCGDNIKAEEFRSWIISDRASSVVNIIQSIQKLILFGEEKAFGKPQFAEIFLSFTRDFLPQSFGKISRFVNDCDTLFHDPLKAFIAVYMQSTTPRCYTFYSRK